MLHLFVGVAVGDVATTELYNRKVLSDSERPQKYRKIPFRLSRRDDQISPRNKNNAINLGKI